MKRITTLLLLCSILLTGCASMYPQVTYSTFGEANPEEEARVIQSYSDNKANKIPKEEVTVLVNTIPEGIEIKDGNISILPGYKHTLVGKYTISTNTAAMVSLWKFADYRTELKTRKQDISLPKPQ